MAATLTRARVGLVEAASDRALFGLDLSEPQEDLLSKIENNGTVVAVCGRQAGKTLAAACGSSWNLLLRPDLDERAQGRTRHVISIANSKEQAQILLTYVRQFCERSKFLRGEIVYNRDDRIVFRGNRVLLALPCEARLARGLSASMIVMDEAGHMVNATFGPRTGERIYAAIRPSLTIYGAEARAFICSTPGESDFFTNTFQKAASGELSGAVAFSAPTRLMNPIVSDEFLEQERALLGEADFLREYEGQFIAGSSSFFTEEEIQDVMGAYTVLPSSAATEWVIGADVALAHDPSGIAVVGRSAENARHLVCARVERWQPSRTRRQRRGAKTAAQTQEVANQIFDRVAALSKEYHAPVVIDQHLQELVKAGLHERGVAQVNVRPWTGPSLSEGFGGLRARIVSDTISLPREPELVAELLRLRSRPRQGRDVIEIPRLATSHSDMAVALTSAVAFLDSKPRSRPGYQDPGQKKFVERWDGKVPLPPGCMWRGSEVIADPALGDDLPPPPKGCHWQKGRHGYWFARRGPGGSQ
jgi:hypothetical protein